MENSVFIQMISASSPNLTQIAIATILPLPPAQQGAAAFIETLDTSSLRVDPDMLLAHMLAAGAITDTEMEMMSKVRFIPRGCSVGRCITGWWWFRVKQTSRDFPSLNIWECQYSGGI